MDVYYSEISVYYYHKPILRVAQSFLVLTTSYNCKKVWCSVCTFFILKTCEKRPRLFGTMSHFVEQFTIIDDPEQVIIDFSRSHVWDHSAVTAISKVILKYRQMDKHVVITGLNEESKRLVDRIGISAP